MWKKTINSCHILKTVSRKVLPCQKVSVFESEYIFFQNKCMTISFCHLLKNVSRQVIPLQKVSLIEIEYTFFNQRKEMCVEEDYHFLSRFKKFIPTSTSIPKSFSVWKWIHFFQSNKGNLCERSVWLSIFVTLDTLEISLMFFFYTGQRWQKIL